MIILKRVKMGTTSTVSLSAPNMTMRDLPLKSAPNFNSWCSEDRTVGGGRDTCVTLADFLAGRLIWKLLMHDFYIRLIIGRAGLTYGFEEVL